MKKILAGLVAAAGFAGVANADIIMTFDEGIFLSTDVVPVGTYYTGVTFGSSSTGSPLVSRNRIIGGYNVSSFPSGAGGGEYWVYGDVGVTSALDGSGNDGRITFDNGDATYVELGYSCNSNFFLEAYDASNNLIDIDTGGANLRFINSNEAGPGTLRVDAPAGQFIKYVIVHDTGNFWVIDNIRTDASGIVPAPGAAALLGLGALAMGRRRR
ncbi:MAG: MYXO-CTERM sorting domain-containing protein [Planctomycetota bacterium]|nr:MYXO-CTERM sorting domain-containing protein [Planctomycetota bacterium]